MVDAILEGTTRQNASTLTPRAMDVSREEIAGNIGAMAQVDLMRIGIEIRSLNMVRVVHKGVDKVG
jgi:hypothetical protein